MQNPDRAERLTRRIESFSDLVIGFSLALLGLTLKIPPQITDLAAHPWWLIAYAWTFTVIALLWYTHQRLFSHFFTPSAGTIVVNFLALAMIGLIVYFVQVFVQYRDEFSRVWAALCYFTALGTTLLSFGALYAHGVRARWQTLDAQLRFTGVRYAVRSLFSGFSMLTGVAIGALRPARDMNDVFPLVYLAIGSLLVSRVIAMILKPRILGTANA